MATDKTVYGPHESKWGFSVESTFGTAIADGGTFVILDGDWPSVEPGVFRDQSIRGGRGLIESSSDRYTTQAGQLRKISFSNLKARLTYLPDFLYMVLQNVSEAVGTPFEKTFTINHATSAPVFASNNGHFVTIGLDRGIASRDRKFTSCILQSLTLSATMGQGGDGRLMMSGDFISGFQATNNSTYSGTWAHAGNNYYDFNAPTTLKVENQDVVCYAWDLTINNNARGESPDSNGEFETYGLGPYEITGNMTVKWDQYTASVFASSTAGTNSLIQIATGTDGATGNIDFLLSTADLIDPQDDFGDPVGQKVQIPFRAAGVAGDASAALVVTNSDGVDRSW